MRTVSALLAFLAGIIIRVKLELTLPIPKWRGSYFTDLEKCQSRLSLGDPLKRCWFSGNAKTVDFFTPPGVSDSLPRRRMCKQYTDQRNIKFGFYGISIVDRRVKQDLERAA